MATFRNFRIESMRVNGNYISISNFPSVRLIYDNGPIAAAKSVVCKQYPRAVKFRQVTQREVFGKHLACQKPSEGVTCFTYIQLLDTLSGKNYFVTWDMM